MTTQNVLKNLMTKLYSELFKNRHVSPIYTEIIEYVESTVSVQVSCVSILNSNFIVTAFSSIAVV